MLILRLAFKNLLGAGLKTWLNGFVLSISFLAIITTQALLKGMYQQTTNAMISAEIGGGQYWHPEYDPYDPLTLQDSHGKIPENLTERVSAGHASPILIIQGTIYPNGRIRPVVFKGIGPYQDIVNIPTEILNDTSDYIPVLIGRRMARAIGLNTGDYLTLQWRDANGMFDAQDAIISQVMKTSVQSIDVNQIWMPLHTLQDMAGMQGEATIVICEEGHGGDEIAEGWRYKNREFLLKDVKEMIESKSFGSVFIYMLLLFLSMLAIFDTQIFSIFRRKKEIGTLMSLGLTRGSIVRLFTLEGSLQAALGGIIELFMAFPSYRYLLKRVGHYWRLRIVMDSRWVRSFTLFSQ